MSEFAIQKSVYDALNGIISAAVYDHVPQDSSFPYVVIGEDITSPWDTDTNTGYESVLTLHVWSRYRGKKETKDIQHEIYDVLHRQESNLSVAGQYVVQLLFEQSEIVLDADGLTYHGIQDFRIITEAT